MSNKATLPPLGSRLRERIQSISPFSLTLLGLIGILGSWFPSLEILKLFHVFWFFALWPLVSILLRDSKQSLGFDTDDEGPRDWLEMDSGWRGHIAFLLGIPLSFFNPLVFRQDAMQLVGSLVAIGRHRGSLPEPETYDQSTNYRLPIEGTWTVVNGSPIKEYSHSWFPATQRYAYDFVITDEEGRTRPAGTDTSIENYYCYNQPVAAPADGVVVDVHDGDPELGRAGGFSHPLKRSMTGNAVTIRHAEDEYSCLAHLVPGSIEVEPDDHVTRGEQIGRCGHSGNSAEPHLHFQIQDHPTFEVSAGLPVRFDSVDVDTPGINVVEQTGWTEPDGSGRYIHAGQRVTSTADDGPNRIDDVVDPSEMTASWGLGRVRMLGRIAIGFSIGGFVTVLAGFVVPSLQTIALALAGLTGLGLVYQAGRGLVDGGRVQFGSFSTVGGVGMTAAVVSAVDVLDMLPELGASPVGTGVFLTGFLLYIAVWEHERRHLLRETLPPVSGVTDE
ncbi:M23 family metallopeptidase [Halostagnicola kamekurae]|uniref:Peptidase family M23 n=1 Tax=Halostagnicola kamekurae TaxID=619731 RepID=A0A1I6TSW8_9EURY|nr:M23 family metallopeptidase [Halostagnicola kamekurae]SFS92168.1 Peptidase family M23 [Halostagnicola kamekurae]